MLAARRWLVRRTLARVGEACRAVIALPLYALSGVMPRRARQVVFGGNGDRFTDNAKHLFLHLTTDPRFDCTWITNDPRVVELVRSLGHRAERRWSVRGMWATLRAGWFVYGAYPSDVNFWLSRGARLLNLWHGIPMKAIEFDIRSGPLARVYRSPVWSPIRLAFLDRFRRPNYVVSPSSFLSERCFQSAFRIDRDRCLEVGYPRTDTYFHVQPRVDIARRLGLGEHVGGASIVMGYFPTWRDDGRDFLREAGFSFDELDERLRVVRRLLVFKAHPNFADMVPKNRTWSNVVILDPALDVNDVLPMCDLLVTDYSSVAFDFLLLDRPIVYFLPDHERYVRGRNLYFDVSEMTAGPVATSTAELYRLLTSDLTDDAAPRRRRLRHLVWGDYAGAASTAIAEHLAELVEP